MGTPHKYAAVIKAWADGAEVECRAEGSNDKWLPVPDPQWTQTTAYRIKPAPNKTKKYKRALFSNTKSGAWVVCMYENYVTAVNSDTDFVRFVDTEWQQEVV